MVLHCMLQDYDFKHFPSLGLGKLALGDEVGNMGGQGMDTLMRELADLGEEFIPKMPEMLLGLDNGTDSIKGKLGCPFTLQGNDPIVNEGLKSFHPQRSSSATSSLCGSCQPHQY